MKNTVTERGASEYDSVSFSAISRLRILGITLAMDDFGAGDSGLRKLKSFGYDEIKIDKSLVDNLLVSEESQMILKSIVGMSANLGLVVVIEGIESVDQLFWLKNEYQKSDLIIQGYCYSKPLDVVSLVNAMKTGFGIGDTSQGSQQLLAHQSPALALPCAPL